jgi:hypothetical protein
LETVESLYVVEAIRLTFTRFHVVPSELRYMLYPVMFLDPGGLQLKFTTWLAVAWITDL